MNAFKKNTGNECGSVILSVVVILAVLTIIGVSVTNLANNELKVSNNDKNYKIAFYHAEGGVYTISKWISQVVDEEEVPDPGNLHYADDDAAQLKREVMGYDLDDDIDIWFLMQTETGESSTVEVNFTRNSRAMAMGGGEAASLGEGASNGGMDSNIALPYWVVSTVTTPTNTTAYIVGKYLKMDSPGGL